MYCIVLCSVSDYMNEENSDMTGGMIVMQPSMGGASNKNKNQLLGVSQNKVYRFSSCKTFL